ncbi:hypothetical protein EZS27_022798, partial [termite gut metagenome]
MKKYGTIFWTILSLIVTVACADDNNEPDGP